MCPEINGFLKNTLIKFILNKGWQISFISFNQLLVAFLTILRAYLGSVRQ